MCSPFVMQLKFYLRHIALMQFVFYSPQAQCSFRLTLQCCSICLVVFKVRKTGPILLVQMGLIWEGLERARQNAIGFLSF